MIKRLNALLLSTLISSSVSAAEVLPTTDEIKALFQPMTWEALATEVPEIQVQTAGDNFLVTVPAVRLTEENGEEGGVVPAQKIALTRNGTFANYAQYTMTSNDLAYMKQVLQVLAPDITLSAKSFSNKNEVVPSLKLTTKQSLNITELAAAVPEVLELTVDSLASDGLLKAVSETKMDVAASVDGTGISLTTPQVALTLPHITLSSQGTKADITADNLVQLASAESVHFSLEAPKMSLLTLLMPLSVTLDGVMRVDSEQDTALTLEFNHISFPENALFLNSPLTPTDIRLQLALKGVSRGDLLALSQADPNDAMAKRDALLKTATLEVKDASFIMAGGAVRLTGMIKPYALGEAWSATADFTMTIVNMDKLSPVPTVNEVQCKQAETFAEQNPEQGERLKQLSCAPQGGMLDFLRPFMTEKRTMDEAGQTLDTFHIEITTDAVMINGQPLTDMPAGL